MKVVFNDLEEWLTELKEDCTQRDCVMRHVVRATYRKRTDGHLPIQNVGVVAGYRNEVGEIVELVHNVGQVIEHDPASAKVWQRAAETLDKVTATAKALHLTVRGGAFTDN